MCIHHTKAKSRMQPPLQLWKKCRLYNTDDPVCLLHCTQLNISTNLDFHYTI